MDPRKQLGRPRGCHEPRVSPFPTELSRLSPRHFCPRCPPGSPPEGQNLKDSLASTSEVRPPPGSVALQGQSVESGLCIIGGYWRQCWWLQDGPTRLPPGGPPQSVNIIFTSVPRRLPGASSFRPALVLKKFKAARLSVSSSPNGPGLGPRLEGTSNFWSKAQAFTPGAEL